MALANKDDNKDNYKKIFEELIKERFYEIKKTTDEINKGTTAKKRFDDFSNDIELFKRKSREIKLEEEKNCRMSLSQI